MHEEGSREVVVLVVIPNVPSEPVQLPVVRVSLLRSNGRSAEVEMWSQRR